MYRKAHAAGSAVAGGGQTELIVQYFGDAKATVDRPGRPALRSRFATKPEAAAVSSRRFDPVCHCR